MNQTFTVKEAGLTLTQAIKLNGLANSGGHAKALISGGLVKVNGQPELRKKKQLLPGDLVEVAMVNDAGYK